ncbi:MAG TPA: glycosyltransferase family 2 protein [Dehalococcoidia bacterium]|nr:glycosyltransferase family 2 protein [Dehalococcoidia bacterium]
MSGRPTITALICALNEEASIPHILPMIPEWVDEVLLVDGHSTDKTVEMAKEFRPDIKVVYQPGKGKGDALKCGIENSTGDIIVTLDADGSTAPEEMEEFVKPLLNGYEFAKGSRFRGTLPHNKPWYRILGNWIITLTFDVLFLRRYTDLCSGYNAFHKAAIEQARPWPLDGFENEPFINCRMVKRGVKVIEIAHTDRGRIQGDVKELSWRQGFKAIKTMIRERFRG